MTAPYPPMSKDWQDGYRKGMEYCLAMLAPLSDDDDGMPAIREAMSMLRGQLPVPTGNPDTTSRNCKSTAHNFQNIPTS